MSESHYCYVCGGKLPSTATSAGACTVCQLQLAAKHAPVPMAAPTVVVNTIMQDATALTAGRLPALGTIENYIDAVMQCIEDHLDDTKATAIDGQGTIWNGGDTATVDYQGTRAGTGGTFWIDIHGQHGGSGSKRKSYWEIMVECGAPAPARVIVERAIAASHGSNVVSSKKTSIGQRAVIVRNTTTGRPK